LTADSYNTCYVTDFNSEAAIYGVGKAKAAMQRKGQLAAGTTKNTKMYAIGSNTKMFMQTISTERKLPKLVSNLLGTNGEPIDVCTETLNELHCKHYGRVVHAILHAVSQMHIILLHQYKLVADQQVHGLNVVMVVLTTCYQAPEHVYKYINISIKIFSLPFS